MCVSEREVIESVSGYIERINVQYDAACRVLHLHHINRYNLHFCDMIFEMKPSRGSNNVMT